MVKSYLKESDLFIMMGFISSLGKSCGRFYFVVGEKLWEVLFRRWGKVVGLLFGTFSSSL